MADVRLVRRFAVAPERLFRMISARAGVLQWWGPEGVTLAEEQLDFSRTGPWFSVMLGEGGKRYKVSGHVTHVDPPRSVGLTWAWHDDSDGRGAESHVTLRVRPVEGGAELEIDHRDLADPAQAGLHEDGWRGALAKIDLALKS